MNVHKLCITIVSGIRVSVAFLFESILLLLNDKKKQYKRIISYLYDLNANKEKKP